MACFCCCCCCCCCCLFVCLFVCFSSSCCLFCLFFLVFLFYFFIRDGYGRKIGCFMGDGGMGVVALIRKNTGVLGGAGHYNLCSPEYLGGVFFIFGSGVGRCEIATSWCGKINWVVIRIKLCWSDYKLMLSTRLGKAFSELFIIFLNLFIDFSIYSSACIYSLIFLFIH